MQKLKKHKLYPALPSYQFKDFFFFLVGRGSLQVVYVESALCHCGMYFIVQATELELKFKSSLIVHFTKIIHFTKSLVHFSLIRQLVFFSENMLNRQVYDWQPYPSLYPIHFILLSPLFLYQNKTLYLLYLLSLLLLFWICLFSKEQVQLQWTPSI